MITEQSFLSLVDAFGAAAGLEDSTISHRVFGDSKKITAIRNGGSITLRRANDAIDYFAAHWPEGAAWPDGVCRPEPITTAAE